MADTIQVADYDQDLLNRKNLKKQARAEIAAKSSETAEDAEKSKEEQPREAVPIFPPHYATVRFHTNLGPPGNQAFVEFKQFDIIKDQYQLHWLNKQQESRVLPLDVDAVKCPKCQTIFAGVKCLAR